MVRFESGKDYKSHESESDEGFPVYGSGGIFATASEYLFDGESVLFGRKGTVDKPLWVQGKFWTVDTMYYTTIQTDTAVARFVYYVALTIPFDYYSTNTALPSIVALDLANEQVDLPPFSVQQAIADYLDYETEQIDEFIADQEHLIELLTERRTSTVFSSTIASTGCFQANVQPFGVEKGSSLKPWGWLFSVKLGKMLDEKKHGVSAGDFLPYLRASNVQESGLDLDDLKTMPFSPAEAATYSLEKDDILIVEGGSVGVAYRLERNLPGLHFQKTLNRARARAKLNAQFYKYCLDALRRQGLFDLICNASTIRHLTAEKVEKLLVPTPSLEHQEQIVVELDRELGEIDEMIADAKLAVELSKEKRAALITAAVTGEIDVSDWQRPDGWIPPHERPDAPGTPEFEV